MEEDDLKIPIVIKTEEIPNTIYNIVYPKVLFNYF